MNWEKEWVDSPGSVVTVVLDDNSVARGHVRAALVGGDAPALVVVTEDGREVLTHPKYCWPVREGLDHG